jgi:glutamine synthetase
VNEKDRAIAGFFLAAIKAGYKVTFEGPSDGKAGQGVHMHVGLTKEMQVAERWESMKKAGFTREEIIAAGMDLLD